MLQRVAVSVVDISTAKESWWNKFPLVRSVLPDKGIQQGREQGRERGKTGEARKHSRERSVLRVANFTTGRVYGTNWASQRLRYSLGCLSPFVVGWVVEERNAGSRGYGFPRTSSPCLTLGAAP